MPTIFNKSFTKLDLMSKSKGDEQPKEGARLTSISQGFNLESIKISNP